MPHIKLTNPENDHPMLRYFRNDHLPPDLQNVSDPFREMAFALVGLPTPDDANPYAHPVIHDPQERDVALRKLLEAKDAAVRACLP